MYGRRKILREVTVFPVDLFRPGNCGWCVENMRVSCDKADVGGK
jgi:hypothetical protein